MTPLPTATICLFLLAAATAIAGSVYYAAATLQGDWESGDGMSPANGEHARSWFVVAAFFAAGGCLALTGMILTGGVR